MSPTHGGGGYSRVVKTWDYARDIPPRRAACPAAFRLDIGASDRAGFIGDLGSLPHHQPAGNPRLRR